MKLAVGRHYAPAQVFAWREWQIEITAYSDILRIEAITIAGDAYDDRLHCGWFMARDLSPAFTASLIMWRLRRFAATYQEGTDNV